MTLAMVLEIAEKINNQQTVGLVSKEYPSRIETMLKNQGVNFKIEEIPPTSKSEPIWSRDGGEEYISGYREIKSEHSFYIFSSWLPIKNPKK